MRRGDTELMRTFALAAILLVAAACASTPPAPPVTTPAGHGAVSIEVIPNPIVATHISGNTYAFPFEVVVRETGGRAVTIQRVSATVALSGGFTVAREAWDAAQIHAMGHDPNLPAHGITRMRLNQRREVPDERLFSSVVTELKVEAVDDTGTATTARTQVTVTK
jgi:hypothetical protein